MIAVFEDTKNLESMIKNIKQKKAIMSLLEKIIEKEIEDFKYLSIEKLNSMIEYDFSLIKINITLKNNEQKRVYIRMIKGGMIKESIFCYWSLLYEEYLNCNNKVPLKVTITEKLIEQNKKNILLTIDKDLNYCTEICLVEINKFLEDIIGKDNEFKELTNYFSNNDNDILFLGII